jgi:integrase
MSPTMPSRATPTLANAVAATAANGTLSPRQRHDRMSAIRTVARVIGRDPTDIPAEPRLLARRLAEIGPAAHGLSPARWANIRSLVRAVVAEITTISPGRHQNALTPAWQSLWDRLSARRHRAGLSRLMHFCAGRQIDPEDVDQRVFDDFAVHLQQSLLAAPEITGRSTMTIWNEACSKVVGWPGRPIALPKRADRYTLPWSSFPATLHQDVMAWLDRLAGLDPLADIPFRPVRPGTLQTREFQVRSFASALVLRGVPATALTGLADLVVVEQLKHGLRFYLDRSKGQSTSAIAGLVAMLKSIALHWVRVPPDHLSQIAALQRRLAVRSSGLTERNRKRLRTFDDGGGSARALLRLPQRLFELADRLPAERRPQAALLVQSAVAIELLLMAPLRIGNLAMLDRDQHLVRPGRARSTLHLVIEGRDVKNGENLEYPLPAQTVALVERYLAEFHPALAPSGSTALFPGRRAPLKGSQALGKQISATIFRHTGLRINPHLFRHIAAKLFLDAEPGAYEVIRRVLGHRSIDTTTSFYTGFETAAAVRHFDRAILRHREGT